MSEKNAIAEKLLTDLLADVILKTLTPGFHGRGGVFFDVKDGQLIATDSTVTSKTIPRKQYEHA